jgi:phosphocarrier protein HPr
MSVERKTVIVKNKQGLHARPAALFVQVANKFDSRVTVIYNNEKVNGKSIMGILMLGAEQGTEIIIEADGKDAQEVLAELEKVVNCEEEL